MCEVESSPSHSADYTQPHQCTRLEWLRYQRSQELLWLHSVISCLFCVWTYLNTTNHTTLRSMSTFTSLSSTTTMETGGSYKPLLPNHELHGVTHHRTYNLLSMDSQTWNTMPSPTHINKPSQNAQHAFLTQKHSVSSFNHIIWKVSTASVKTVKFH
jgi:hypothetical protein